MKQVFINPKSSDFTSRCLTYTQCMELIKEHFDQMDALQVLNIWCTENKIDSETCNKIRQYSSRAYYVPKMAKEILMLLGYQVYLVEHKLPKNNPLEDLFIVKKD